jgi:hypothetical protein
MNARYRMVRRGAVDYAQDNVTGQQVSLKTTQQDDAKTLKGIGPCR